MKNISIGQKKLFTGIGGIGMSGLAQVIKIWDLIFKEAIKLKIKIH